MRFRTAGKPAVASSGVMESLADRGLHHPLPSFRSTQSAAQAKPEPLIVPSDKKVPHTRHSL